MKITVDAFSADSIDAAAKKLEEYADGLEEKAEKLCELLANMGYETAFQIMAGHVYSGETISSLQVIEESPTKYILQAGSVALLFFEFGAGVRYGGGHPGFPNANFQPSAIGSYGNGHGSDPNGWWFPTDDQNLIVRTDKNGQGWGHSYGNPPHMPFYNASRKIRDDLIRAAQEVFKT